MWRDRILPCRTTTLTSTSSEVSFGRSAPAVCISRRVSVSPLTCDSPWATIVIAPAVAACNMASICCFPARCTPLGSSACGAVVSVASSAKNAAAAPASPAFNAATLALYTPSGPIACVLISVSVAFIVLLPLCYARHPVDSVHCHHAAYHSTPHANCNRTACQVLPYSLGRWEAALPCAIAAIP